MSKDIWEDDEDSISEYDLLREEAEEAEALAEAMEEEDYSQPALVQGENEALEEIAEESAFDLDGHESNVIYNARLRLETAKLYEMLINHNLFEGVDASPQAINKVQNELKNYIVQRLEILLGLEEEPTRAAAKQYNDFNEVEIDFLKQLCYKGTLGKSMQVSANAPRKLKPMVRQKPNKLRSIGAPVKIKREVEEIEEHPLPRRPTRRVKKKRAAPIKRKKLKSGMGVRNLSRTEINEAAVQDIKDMKGKTPFHEMSTKEKLEEIKRVNEKHAKKPEPDAKIPMMDFNAQQMKYMTEQSMRSSNTGNMKNQFNVMLANALMRNKNDNLE